MQKLTIPKAIKAPPIDSLWDKSPWNQQLPNTLDNFMGDEPDHFPSTQFKLTYDDEAIYLIFKVEDQYIRAVSRTYQGHVCRDSCVEFFFNTHPDKPQSYFNLEINCCGVALFAFQEDLKNPSQPIPEQDFKELTIAHSLPKELDDEIQSPQTWTLEYRLPFSVLETYSPVVRPEPGVQWRANFYKCADGSSHPHWLTWAPVDFPKPKFHLPEYFGVLNFQ